MSNEIEKNQLALCANQIEASLVVAAQSFLKIGESLVKARLILKSDVDFAKWRQTETEIKSQRTALAYMQVYRRFAETKLSGRIGYSVLQELVSAPQEAIEKVEQMVDDGNSPTVKETRELVKDAKAEGNTEETTTEAPAEMPESQKEEGDPAPSSGGENESRGVRTTADVVAEAEGGGGRDTEPTIPSWLTEERMMLALPEHLRITGATNPWHCFGLSAYFETMPSPETIERLRISYHDSYKDTPEGIALAEAYSSIMEFLVEIENDDGK